jgi:hypothetical protein
MSAAPPHNPFLLWRAIGGMIGQRGLALHRRCFAAMAESDAGGATDAATVVEASAGDARPLEILQGASAGQVGREEVDAPPGRVDRSRDGLGNGRRRSEVCRGLQRGWVPRLPAIEQPADESAPELGSARR